MQHYLQQTFLFEKPPGKSQSSPSLKFWLINAGKTRKSLSTPLSKSKQRIFETDENQKLNCPECIPIHPEEVGQDTRGSLGLTPLAGRHRWSLGWWWRAWCFGKQWALSSLLTAWKQTPYPLALHIRSGTSPKSRILFTQKHVSQTWGQTVQLLSIYTVVFLAAMIHLFFLITRELPGASSLGGTPTQVMNLFRQVRYE